MHAQTHPIKDSDNESSFVTAHTLKSNREKNLTVQMVEQQVRAWAVLDEDVLQVMQSLSRTKFLPPKLRAFAQTDSRFTLSPNFILPAPSVQGKILQALSIEPDAAILQLGLGSAYLSACLAELGGHLYVLDEDSAALTAAENLCSELEINNISFVERPWKRMLSELENQYDAIVVQHAFPSVPEKIKNALRLKGVAVLFTGDAPVMTCVRVERIGEQEWLSEELFETVVAKFPHSAQNTATFEF